MDTHVKQDLFYFLVEAFLVLSEVPDSHHYYSDHFVNTFTPDKPRKFTSVVRKEMMLLKSSLPSGILIRGFENAMVCLGNGYVDDWG